MTGVAKNTILKLLADLGEACSNYMDKAMRNLPCKRIQVDEIWSFCHAKAKNVPEEKRGILGLAMFERVLRLTPTQSLFPAGMLDAATVAARMSLSAT